MPITCKLIADGIAYVPSTGKYYIDPHREQRRAELLAKGKAWLESQKKQPSIQSEELVRAEQGHEERPTPMMGYTDVPCPLCEQYTVARHGTCGKCLTCGTPYP